MDFAVHLYVALLKVLPDYFSEVGLYALEQNDCV